MIITGTATEILQLCERVKRGELDSFRKFATMPGTFGIRVEPDGMSLYIATENTKGSNLVQKIH